MIFKKEFAVSAGEMADITEYVRACVAKSGIKEGICSVYEPHCDGGIMVLGNQDPNIRKDIAADLARLVPPRTDYLCAGNPAEEAAHTKSFLMGCSKDLVIGDGDVVLGENRSVYLARFCGEGSCVCAVTVLGRQK